MAEAYNLAFSKIWKVCKLAAAILAMPTSDLIQEFSNTQSVTYMWAYMSVIICHSRYYCRPTWHL